MFYMLGANPFEQMLNPIVNLLNMAINPILTLVGAIGTIFCIFLGIKPVSYTHLRCSIC